MNKFLIILNVLSEVESMKVATLTTRMGVNLVDSIVVSGIIFYNEFYGLTFLEIFMFLFG